MKIHNKGPPLLFFLNHWNFVGPSLSAKFWFSDFATQGGTLDYSENPQKKLRKNQRGGI